jgi:hypothetical protein
MNQAHVDSDSAANPFTSFMDPSPCLEAHGRLSRLPQKQYRLLGMLNLPKRPEAAAPADSTEDDDEGVITEMADLDDLGSPADISDIGRIPEGEQLNG